MHARGRWNFWSSVSKCRSVNTEGSTGRLEEGLLSAEEPLMPHLEGERRCGCPGEQRECEQRERPYQQDHNSSTEVGMSTPHLGT